MTNRRRPSRSRRKTIEAVSRATPARPAGSKHPLRKPTLDRDGKATVACPNCGARYRVPEDALKTRAVCADCHRQFTPFTAAQGRAPRQDNSKPFIYGAVTLVAMVILGFGVRFMAGFGEPERTQDETPKAIQLGNKTPEVQAVMAWALGVSRRGLLSTTSGSDMDAIQRRYGIDSEFPVTRTSGQAKSDLERQILAALFDAEDTEVYRLYVPDFGAIQDEDMVAAKKGRVNLTLKPKDARAGASARVDVFYHWDAYDKRFQVSDWKVRRMGQHEAGVSTETTEPETRTETQPGGPPTAGGSEQKVSVPVVPGPLDHLETTSPEDRSAIDAALAQLSDIDAPSRFRTEAMKTLEDHGKAAMPRLLDELFATPVASLEDSFRVNLLARTLMRVTGEDYAFNVRNRTGDTGFSAAEQDRVKLVQKWYSWWAERKDLEDWRKAPEKEETLDKGRRGRRGIDGLPTP